MVIRSGGMYAARSIFVEVRLPSGVRSARKTGQWSVFSENGPVGPGKKCHPCGFAAREPRKGREANPSGGFVGGSQDPHAVNVQSVTEHLQFFFPYPIICQKETGGQENGCEADG